jgi:hypothetical protein
VVRQGAHPEATATVQIETGGATVTQTFEGQRAVNMLLVCLGAIEQAMRWDHD